MSMNAFITGAYDTAVGELPGSSCMALHAEAALGAVADAGLQPSDIDGVLCAYSFTEPHLMLASVFCEYLGIHPGTCLAIQAGGASACIMVMQAAALVASGQCNHVLVVTGDNRLTGLSRDGAVAALAEVGHPQFERPFGISVPASYGLVARRYMHEYGVSREQLAAIAVEHRRHAARHPKAHKREPITIADVLASKPIAEPLHLLDCCQESDGGVAIVVVSAERAKDLPHKPVTIAAAASGSADNQFIMTSYYREQLAALPEMGLVGDQLWRQSGLGPSDMDAAILYDHFTPYTLLQLEELGFCGRGEAKDFVRQPGALEVGGTLPLNTHGGQLGEAYIHGMNGIAEAVRQIRGTSVNQVPEASKVVVTAGTGVPTSGLVLTG